MSDVDDHQAQTTSGTHLEDVFYEISDFHEDMFDLRLVEVEATELNFHSAPAELIQTHFPDPVPPAVRDVSDGVTGLQYLAIAGASIIGLSFLLWVVAKVIQPKRPRTTVPSLNKRTSELRPTDALSVLRESFQGEEAVTPSTLRSIVRAMYKLSTENHSNLEAVLNDYFATEGSNVDGIAMVDTLLLGAMKQLRSPGGAALGGSVTDMDRRRNKVHIEDRLRAYCLRAEQADVLVELEVVRDALREAAALSGRRHTEEAVARLRRAIAERDEYSILYGMELLREDVRHRGDVRAGEVQIQVMCDEQDEEVRREERRRSDAHFADVLDTFKALSLASATTEDDSFSRTPRSIGSGKEPPLAAPIVGEDGVPLPEPSAPPLDPSGEGADEAAGGSSRESKPTEGETVPPPSPVPAGPRPLTLSGKRDPTQDAASHLVTSQWTMEALRIKREAQQATDRRLQALADQRRHRADQARRDAQRQLEARDAERRRARLALDGMAEQKKLRMGEEGERLRREAEEVWREFETAKERQLAADTRWLGLWMAAVAVTYVLALSGFNMQSEGLPGLFRWLLGLARSACSFITCDFPGSGGGAFALLAVRRSASAQDLPPRLAGAPVLLSLPLPLPAQLTLPLPMPLPLPDAQQLSELNHTAVQVVQTYRSLYRVGAEAVSVGLLRPVSQYALQYAFSGWAAPITRTALLAPGPVAELYAAAKCAFHVFMRSLPSMAAARLLRFFGLKWLSGTVAFALSVLCFGDVLVQLALGPLLPLLLLWIAHTILYALLGTYTEHLLRWPVYGVDVRSFILYFLYPLSILAIVYHFATI